jgi:hypothetical protein
MITDLELKLKSENQLINDNKSYLELAELQEEKKQNKL